MFPGIYCFVSFKTSLISQNISCFISFSLPDSRTKISLISYNLACGTYDTFNFVDLIILRVCHTNYLMFHMQTVVWIFTETNGDWKDQNKILMMRQLVDNISKFMRVEFETLPLITPPDTFIGDKVVTSRFFRHHFKGNHSIDASTSLSYVIV